MTTRLLTLLMIPVIIIVNYLSQTWKFWSIAVENLARRTSESIATPAWRAFSIWWLIYLGIFWYCIYQFWNKKNQPIIDKINPLVLINLVANALWYYFSTIEWLVWVSFVLIIVMWVTLWMIVKKIQQENWLQDESLLVKRLIPFTFCVYFGWITVAAPLNLGGALTDLWYTWAETSPIAIFCRTAITYITSIVVYTKTKRLDYIAVIVWALSAVIMGRLNDRIWDTAIYQSAGAIMYIAIGLLVGMVSFVTVDRILNRKK